MDVGLPARSIRQTEPRGRFPRARHGYSVTMSVERVPDDVPIADAVEQARDVATDEEATAPAADAPALETPDADWQEQSTDAGEDLDGRDGRY